MTQTDDGVLWTRGELVIRADVLRAVEDEARRGYAEDSEVCGYLAGPAEPAQVIDEHVAMPNVANKLHAIDPETYFRTARTFFAFNEKKFDDAVGRGREQGRPIKVLYHSHLDAGAYFSPTDRAVLSMGEPPAEEGGAITMGPGPAWPLAFLVTSVQQGVIQEHNLFVWSDERGDFVQSRFEVREEL